MKAIDTIQFNEKGLVPVITQDYSTNQILMVAWMNEEAFALTLKTKKAVYFSRSRKKLWFKGEKSGNYQDIVEIFTDCDQDVVLLKVNQKGGIACHTGRAKCFFNKLEDNRWKVVSDVVKDPKDIYG